jgi:uncharacterized phage-associated protein
MRSALEIANYFLYRVDREAGDMISPKKLQKLVYYAQVWSMVLRNKPLFAQTIEAWIHGPVVREVWEVHKEYKFNAIPQPETPLPAFESDEIEVLEYVWNRYGELSAHQLEKLTHAENPWLNARVGLAPDQRSSNPVSLEDMKAYHAAESPWGKLPVQEQALFKAMVYELLSRPEEFDTHLSPELEGLKNALLDTIEREHPHYEKAMTEALVETLHEPNSSPAMTSNEFREWLTQL